MKHRRLSLKAATLPLALGAGLLGAGMATAALAAPCAPRMSDRNSPCNPCAARKRMMRKANPCAARNPCAAHAREYMMRMRQKNPCAVKKPANPCAAKNPCAVKKSAGPCNPCAVKGKYANPCNPCAMKRPANPCAARNPCAAKKPANPCSAKKPMMDRQGMKMGPAGLNRAFAAILPTLKKAYRGGAHFVADGRWAAWKNFAKHPYAGSTHGGRYLVNYANPVAAKVYGQYNKLRHMPPGGIIVKPSFTLEGGKPKPGPLFVMEKMKKGWNPATMDWRYAMILPGGKTFRVTKGPNGARVAFCQDCHGTAKNTDALMFLPEEARVK